MADARDIKRFVSKSKASQSIFNMNTWWSNRGRKRELKRGGWVG